MAVKRKVGRPKGSKSKTKNKKGEPNVILKKEASAGYKTLDLKQIEQMAYRQFTIPMMSSILGVSQSFLYRRCEQDEELLELIKSGREKGKGALQSFIFEQALGGNMTAAIHMSNKILYPQSNVIKGEFTLAPPIYKPELTDDKREKFSEEFNNEY